MTQPSRRTLARAAAWSAPIVAVSVGAPAASASPTTCSQCLTVAVGSIGTYVARLSEQTWTVTFAATLANACTETERRIVMMGVADATLITSGGVSLSTAFAATDNSHLGETVGGRTTFGGRLTATSTTAIDRFCVSISVSDFSLDPPAVNDCTTTLCWRMSPVPTDAVSFGAITTY